MTMNRSTKRIQPTTLAGLVLDCEDGAGLLAVRNDVEVLSSPTPKEAPGAPATPGGTGGKPPPAGAPPTARGLSASPLGAPPPGPAAPGTGDGAAGAKRPGGIGAGAGGIVTDGRGGGGAGACEVRAAAVLEAVRGLAVLRLGEGRRPPLPLRPAAPAGSASADS